VKLLGTFVTRETAMNIHEQKVGDVTVLTLGETDVGDNVDTALKVAIHQLIQENSSAHIVVDLAKVKWMTSSAFGLLAAAQGKLRPNGGGIHLARPKDRVVSAFNIMQLEKLFSRYDSVEQAVNGFKS
jgi:anti-anti-sigma factor